MRRRAAAALLSLWVPVMLVPGGYLLAGHVAGLPVPAAGDARVESAVAASRSPSEEGGWLVLHVLYGACGCSMRILENLVERGPSLGVPERVLLVDAGDEAAARARKAGFPVERLTADDLDARYHIESSPLFAVADPAGELRYLGGYTERKRGPVILDTAIFAALVRGETVPPLPALGCAVSRRLKDVSDPLGVR